MKPWELIKLVLTLLFLAFVVWLFAAAWGYNTSRIDLCAGHDLVMAQEYPWGQYGCAEVIPFDELEAR